MLNKNKHLWCKKSKILGSLLLLALFVVCTIFINTDGAYAATGINPEVNFQGRLLNSEGATVPDGYYNIEFKIYENGNGQSSGDSTGSPAGTLLWTEDYLNANSQGVEVVDGFLSVQLGSICSFSGGSCQGNTNLGVNWNTNPLWLSMNVAGTGASCSPFSACSPDGEMLPMKELSSDAYSLNSAELNGLSSSEFLQLAQGAQTDSSTASSIFINKTGGSGDLVELQASGNDAFVVTNDGDLTFGNNANHNISVTTAGSGSSGKSLTLTAGAAGTGGSALTGGTLNLQGGAGGGTNGNGGNVSIDAGQASGSGTNGTLSLGSQYASTLTIGNSSSTTTLQGTVNVSGPATFSSLITANGGVTVAGGQNLTLSSGIGTYSQTYVSTATGTDNVATWTVSNSNTGATLTTVNAHNIALAGSANSSGSDNVTNGVNFANVTAQTGNTFNALNVGTGFTNILQYNGNSLINGTGILQSAAVSGTYSNLTGTGALATGSIASGFGTISTANNITTSATVQGGTVNATTTLEINGANINTASTLSNVAYLPAATQTFTGANTFSASGTALSVTNNATISGTGTIGTLSVTNNGTVGGTLGITGLTTASGGLTVAGGQNLTLSSGIGTYSQTYVSTATGTDNVATWTVSNSNTGATLTTVNAHNIALAGSANSSGSDNVTNGVNFANVTAQTGNTFNALNVGTGFTNILQYNGNSLINGTGILQSAAVSGTYSNLTGTGALATGSIASGFGTISTANNITTSATVQGGTVNATTTLEINGANINTASTLSNVAYLPAATQTFTGANTFSASGTALSVTNNATISGTGTIGTLSVTNNGTVGGTLGITGLTTASGGLTVAGGQNLTLSSGIGTYSQTYVSTATGTDNVATWTVSNSNTGATLTTVNAHNIALAGSANSSGSDNVTNGVNFANVTAQTGNTFNALNVGTGFTNILQYNGNSLINGTGILQSAAVSGTYSNLTGTGALATGSIASGFGTISTANNITTSATVQGGTVNATTTLEINGANINTASTLSNVAYLPAATQTFTGANTFSASGTALSVTNNATISGTGTIGTLSVTNNGTVGGTLGITGLTTASGGLTVAGGQNLTLSSGIGTYSQTYVSTATGNLNVSTINATNSNTGTLATTINADNVSLVGTNNTNASENTLNGINFSATAATNNTINALNVGTGFTNILQYNGNSLINGTGILQSAAVSGTYSNLTGTGALATGSIASGFGTISTANNITTSATVQGGTVNATTTLEINGANINTASTLSNVAYLPAATQTFTGANTFSASGTALSVTNNATISGTGTIGTLSVTNNGTVGGTLGITGLTTASGGLTVAGGQNLTLSSGIGTYSQTYVSTATGNLNVSTINATNSNTGTLATTINADNVSLVGTNNTNASENTLNGINFSATAATNNTINALNVGTGFTNILQYNGNSLINGTGILQSAAVSGTYSNLTGTGALATGSIASGFGTISTANNITTSATVQGGTVNATTTLEINGANINTASTLSNVAYLPATSQTFTGANTFSASGTALSVTNNATISGTGTIGTLSVTNNGTVGGTLGITGLTTASGGLTVAGGQNLTLSSGIGTYSQTYVSTATGNLNVSTINATNSNTGTLATTINADNVSLVGTNNTNASENTLNGINFSATAATNNTINALNVGTGFSNILQYNGTSLINGTGILQSAAVSGTYSNLTGTGALAAGSIASGFGVISTANNITTSATVQGGTVNATTTLELNGANINTASTLSNVAYLPATSQTFTGANTFSASGTALSVTNNATISGTGTIGTLSVTNNGTVGGTLGITGLTTASGGLTVAGGQNLTLSSGIGTYSQTYVSTATGSQNASTISATNSNTGALATTINADNVSLVGTNNTNAGENTLNGINFSATAATNNTINALNVGTGFSNILQYNGTSLINGTGILQSAAVSGTYSNLTGTGALAAGSIASGFGVISTANNITTSATVQGGTVNATTTLELNGANINTASTLSNVAYLPATSQTFTGANTFSASGTALSVTNNATISGTGTIGTLSVTNNGTVGGTLGITGLTTASGGLTVAGGQNLTLSSGIGTYSQTYVSTATGSQNASTISATNSNTGALATTINADNVSLVGTNNTNAGENTLNGINFSATAATNNTINALNVGTGFSNILQYNGTSLINGTGILQSAAVSGTYSNLTGTGALAAGSIASGFGVISTANNITTSATVQGGTVNATTTLELNGANINTASTLSNVAYLPATSQTFTGANTFSASGTALSVTNNATISGTGTIGTLSVTNNGTVGGTLGITGLTTASGGLTVAGGQNLTLSSGIGTYSQTYVSTATGTDNVATWTVSNGNTGATLTTVNAHNIALAGSANSSGSDNVTNGVNFANVTPQTGNTFNAFNVGTGFSNILQYNGTSLINGTGILQNTAIGTTTNYSNLDEIGTVTSGSLASGFGTISTGNNISTTAIIQGGTVNATTTLELNGANINTASTLSNVAYLPATSQTFTGANTFSASGTALSVTNNATISGTATVGTLDATATTINSGVSGSSGLTLTQIAASSSCSGYCSLLGINSSGQVGASNAAVSLTSPALAYWNGVNDPTTGDQSYPTNPIATYTCSGTCTGSGGTGGFSSGNGELLNPAQANTYGSLNWNFAQVPFEEIQFQVKTTACSLNCSGLTSGADASWFYGYAGNTNSGGSAIPTTEFGCTIAVGSCTGASTQNLTEGYIVYFSEYHDCIGIAYASFADGNQCNNGGGTSNSGASPLASVAMPAGSINDGNWHNVDIQILDNTIYVRWDGNLVLSYTDVYTRDLSDYQSFGFGSRSGGDVDNHYVRGLLVTKLGSNASQYGVDTSSPLASDLYWNNNTTALGVDTSTPHYDLEVDGTTGLEPTVSGQYSAGTACQSNSGTSCSTTAGDLVFGTGTSWSTADVAAGDTIVFSNGESARITTVNSNTELTVSSSQLLASGSDYTIDLGTACIGSSSACTATGTTLTGTSTDFTSSMIGDVINFPDGTTDTITAVSSTTSATVSTSVLQAGSNYTIEAGGLQVSNAASATISNVTVGANSTFGANLYSLTETATGTNTYTVPNASYGYDFYTDLTSTTATTDTYNITGLPSTAGTIVYIETEVTDDGANDQYLILQIGGTQISEIKGTATGTYYDDYILMYSGSAWRIVGEGPQSASDTQSANDYAEWIDYSGDTAPQPGDVLTVGSYNASVTDSDTPYDPALVGVVSTNPYEVAGTNDGHSVVIALAGRVPVNVSLANGPIEPGDPLTSSSIPGVAMLATQPGNIIGTALEAYDGTQSSNQILVQLHVGYDDPTAGSGLLQGDETTGNLAVNGNETVANNDTVQGSLTADDGINASGNSSVSSLSVAENLSVSGNLDVAGTSNVNDLEAQLADVSGQFSVEGNTTLASLLVGNDLTVNGDLTVSGSASIANLAVSGNLSAQNLSVGGTTLLAGDLDLGGQVNTRQATIKTFTSSGPINSGDTVVLDQTAGNAGDVTTTATADDPAVIGVAVSSVSGAGDPVQVAIGGWVQVNVDTVLNTNGTPLIPITPGELIVTSSMPGAVQASNDPAAGTILGKSTANQDANNQVWILITLQ